MYVSGTMLFKLAVVVEWSIRKKLKDVSFDILDVGDDYLGLRYIAIPNSCLTKFQRELIKIARLEGWDGNNPKNDKKNIYR